jgi:hypothetical protein
VAVSWGFEKEVSSHRSNLCLQAAISPELPVRTSGKPTP